jgi:hypothetical protein
MNLETSNIYLDNQPLTFGTGISNLQLGNYSTLKGKLLNIVIFLTDVLPDTNQTQVNLLIATDNGDTVFSNNIIDQVDTNGDTFKYTINMTIL